MYEDQRSRHVILTAHCILNQNAKLDRCGVYPGAVTEVAQVLIESGVGLIQLPCPELICLGLDRGADPNVRLTIEEEDTRIGRLMKAAEGRKCCRRLAENAVDQVKEYLKNGFTLVGLVGSNGSPSCGVEAGWFEDQESEEPGVFVQELIRLMAEANIDVKAKGIRAREPGEAVKIIKGMLGASP